MTGWFRAIAIGAGLFCAWPALALDKETLLTRLEEAANFGDAGAQYGPVEQTGDGDFTIAFIEFADKSAPKPGRVEKVEITGAAVDANGGLTIGSLRFGPATMWRETAAGEILKITLAGGEASGLYAPDYDNPASKLIGATPTRWKIGKIEIGRDGAAAGATIAGLAGEAIPQAGGNATSWALQSGEIRIDTEELSGRGAAGKAKELGLGQLGLTMRSAARWDAITGRAELTELRIDIADNGSLELAATLDGYTGEQVRAMRAASAQAAKLAKTDTMAGLDAMKGVMAAMGEIKLVSAKISFRDGSLTRRVLDWQAKENGQTRDEVVAMIPAMAQGYAQFLDNPAFSASLEAALRSFLAAPDRLTLSLTPAQAAPISGAIGTALMSPGALIDMLGLKVEAE
jgi:hypothetical protein